MNPIMTAKEAATALREKLDPGHNWIQTIGVGEVDGKEYLHVYTKVALHKLPTFIPIRFEGYDVFRAYVGKVTLVDQTQ